MGLGRGMEVPGTEEVIRALRGCRDTGVAGVVGAGQGGRQGLSSCPDAEGGGSGGAGRRGPGFAAGRSRCGAGATHSASARSLAVPPS